MSKQPLVDKLGLVEVSLTMLPGLSLAIWNKNGMWLAASFFAVCSLMAFRHSYNNLFSCLIQLIFTFILGIGLVLLFKTPLLFCLSIILLSLILGYIEFNNPWMKMAISYLFIGTIYPVFKLQITNLNYHEYLQIFLLSIFSLILGLIFSPKPKLKQPFIVRYNPQNIVYYAKYILPVTVCLIIWRVFNMKEAEWLIWSSLSVFNLELSKSKQKIDYRLRGGIIGVITGFALMQILPQNNMLTYCYFAILLLSLRSFNNYVFGFAIRSVAVVLFASSNFMAIGEYRLFNIFIGGAIGFIASWVFDRYFSLTTKSTL